MPQKQRLLNSSGGIMPPRCDSTGAIRAMMHRVRLVLELVRDFPTLETVALKSVFRQDWFHLVACSIKGIVIDAASLNPCLWWRCGLQAPVKQSLGALYSATNQCIFVCFGPVASNGRTTEVNYDTIGCCRCTR